MSNLVKITFPTQHSNLSQTPCLKSISFYQIVLPSHPTKHHGFLQHICSTTKKKRNKKKEKDPMPRIDVLGVSFSSLFHSETLNRNRREK